MSELKDRKQILYISENKGTIFFLFPSLSEEIVLARLITEHCSIH